MISFTDIVTIGFTVLFSTLFENALHKASHYKQSRRLYKWHKLHHKDYTIKKLESDSYIDSTGWFNNMYGFYIIITQGIIFIVSDKRVFTIFYITSTGYALLVEYMHQQFHLKQSIWLHYKWFRKLKQNHLQHHILQTKNFSFFTEKIDRLYNTYLCDNERFNTVISNS